jgi:hypothetical protein
MCWATLRRAITPPMPGSVTHLSRILRNMATTPVWNLLLCPTFPSPLPATFRPNRKNLNNRNAQAGGTTCCRLVAPVARPAPRRTFASAAIALAMQPRRRNAPRRARNNCTSDYGRRRNLAGLPASGIAVPRPIRVLLVTPVLLHKRALAPATDRAIFLPRAPV